MIPSGIKVLPCPWEGVHCGVMVDPDETLPTHRRLKFVTKIDDHPDVMLPKHRRLKFVTEVDRRPTAR